ncbi:MAG: hypothetical protein ACJAQ6_000636 [Arenicella sp.]|jgi:hypothetical protein
MRVDSADNHRSDVVLHLTAIAGHEERDIKLILYATLKILFTRQRLL